MYDHNPEHDDEDSECPDCGAGPEGHGFIVLFFGVHEVANGSVQRTSMWARRSLFADIPRPMENIEILPGKVFEVRRLVWLRDGDVYIYLAPCFWDSNADPAHDPVTGDWVEEDPSVVLLTDGWEPLEDELAEPK